MTAGPLTFASLFSGCGGFDLGFESVGFQPRGAYELDETATQNFRANMGGPVVQTDLLRGVPNEVALQNVDVIIAGPPCQGFSTAGKREVHDERNHLLPLTGVLAARLRPKVLVVENVSGVLAGEHARYWRELEAIMRGAGYRTATVRCQAADLGMAQLRKRVLMFAWSTGRDMRFILPRKTPGTLRQALARVSRAENHHPVRLRRESVEWRIAKRISPGQKLSNVRGGGAAVASWDIPEVFGAVTADERTILELLRRLRRQERRRSHGDADPVSVSRLEHALGARFHRHLEVLIRKGYVRRTSDGVDLVGTFNGKFRRLSWEAPSCTVDTRFGSPRYFLHPDHPRGFTVREAARIQGFPDSYVFTGDGAAQYRMIGNAVPPPLGRLAAEFSRQLLGRCA